MRETILNKATELFLDLGFKSVTMDDIATEMGISKKTIYTHFKNKSVLVKASTEILFLRICSGIDGVRKENQNPIVELYSIKQYVMKHMKNQNSSAQFQLQKYYPAVFAEMRSKQYDYMQDCVVENLNKGLEMGLYRENLDVEFASRIYFLGMVGIKDNDMFPADQFPMITLMEKYLEYHLRGIVTQKGLKKLTETIENYTPNDL
ncbi:MULTISPECIES: TetR/AcrR family transcriptional regulator [Croceibacter]|jgi:AcrR family transcriptional regulator|uniref:TetR/AcrR family transcriptional regulator n=1 Tax=Croceibacter TaxID=216431 RepID=UPI000C5533A5|nr:MULTISPECIES: TetR/AcrR family transcriptional regulator [Croceibacter]MAM23419.1 TetR family transcriptional regulator [Croceibacter sp.]MBG25948.1 TetR family transcriptional regulator [Croceibacter sp.]WSP35162.1 TetR/AcrR family transcriptional regulator [Croceibacter atlanticus]HAT69713.1 TetR family transcriptional regulator [Flavobacteriaceae bacterium]|tara:strand:- start:5609 stop:6223 length:615 start_codon:yes stop_codon:yes gene_type:complete